MSETSTIRVSLRGGLDEEKVVEIFTSDKKSSKVLILTEQHAIDLANELRRVGVKAPGVQQPL